MLDAVRQEIDWGIDQLTYAASCPTLNPTNLLQGGSLLDYVRKRKRLSEAEACSFLQQIVKGLTHCHQHEARLLLPASLLWVLSHPHEQYAISVCLAACKDV